MENIFLNFSSGNAFPTKTTISDYRSMRSPFSALYSEFKLLRVTITIKNTYHSHTCTSLCKYYYKAACQVK